MPSSSPQAPFPSCNMHYTLSAATLSLLWKVIGKEKALGDRSGEQHFGSLVNYQIVLDPEVPLPCQASTLCR